MNKAKLLETAKYFVEHGEFNSYNSTISCSSMHNIKCTECPANRCYTRIDCYKTGTKEFFKNYIKENEEIMELNVIDKSKCQWAWVGDTLKEVEIKQSKRLVIAMMPLEGVIAVSNDNGDHFLNDTFVGVTSWKFYELIKEPKTKTVPMTFEDVLCIPCDNNCVVVFRDKINNKMYLNITINEKCESFCGRSEYSIFNKSTKTYSDWFPLTKTVEVES
jgi:hypothetical protein